MDQNNRKRYFLSGTEIRAGNKVGYFCRGKIFRIHWKSTIAGCVGMAANMIGIKKRVIIVNIGLVDIVMF